ncbi:MAG: OmpA/MotB family protein [Alphaproteobacteria bacterium]
MSNQDDIPESLLRDAKPEEGVEDEVSDFIEGRMASSPFPMIADDDDEEGAKAPLWLITFTDVMALMLTFFVLLYSMSVPQEDKWEEITAALTAKLSRFDGADFNAGSQDVISIDRIDQSRALDLGYLQALVASALKERGVEDIIVFQNADRLIISLPSDLLFKTGSADIQLGGKKVLFVLGGVLSRVKNRVEVAGHADPRPFQGNNGPYFTNWELSLARSASVAAVLSDVGYRREVTIRGLSSARFDELPEDMEIEQRYDLSRRVDIVLMNDDGMRLNAFDVE